MISLLTIATAVVRQGLSLGRYRGPGPSQLLAGNAQRGFFGDLAASELIRGDQLADAVGLTDGIGFNTTVGWLKFAHEGKILFVAKAPLRYNVKWASLYDLGIVHGVDGYGPEPYLNNKPVKQDKVLVIDGNAYIVRLMKGGNADPATSHGGEWDDLIEYVRSSSAVPPEDKWASFFDGNLGIGLSGNGERSLMQEALVSNPNFRLTRGSSLTIQATGPTVSSTTSGWRPVLELIPNNKYLFDIVNVAQDIPEAMLSPSKVTTEGVDLVAPVSTTGYISDFVLAPSGFSQLGVDTLSAVNTVGYTMPDAVVAPSAITSIAS